MHHLITQIGIDRMQHLVSLIGVTVSVVYLAVSFRVVRRHRGHIRALVGGGGVGFAVATALFYAVSNPQVGLTALMGGLSFILIAAILIHPRQLA